MLRNMLTDDSILVRVTVATIVAFGPLYVLQSMGFNWPWVISLLIFAALMIEFVGRRGMDFYGNERRAV